VSSLRRGHANLLCIVPILSYETAFTPLDDARRHQVPVHTAHVAQWIEHQTSNLGVAGSSPARGIFFFLAWCSGSLVVMTSALHAEGRGFNPRPEYLFSLVSWPEGRPFVYRAGMAKWQGNRFVSGRSRVRSPLPALLVLFRCTVHSE
jgi:hypothetical protein